MDFESPDVMKDFPGLYAPEGNKKHSNESDYSDDAEKLTKKDILIGKRKEKKDKKDKERGYAALEGESSPDENESRSPSKSKKSKSFKFTTSKSKEKREKSREKDKEVCDRKKDKEKKSEKKSEKEKIKAEKKEKKQKHGDEHNDIAEGLPIFGASLTTAVERSRCHDGVDIPLPVRLCIDYIEANGLTFEGVYKVSGTKSKILHLRKMFNSRASVDFNDYDIPTVTGLLKMFIRDLPEPLFTSDLLIRFEEAGAILNIGTREKHLKILVENLVKYNQLLLSWLLIHIDNVALNERHNKMNIQSVVAAMSPCLHTSHRLLTALLYHCRTIFPNVTLFPYEPPLQSTAQLPTTTDLMSKELLKQESLLLQIHTEMNAGFVSDNRQELLWEVQRIITQLKRKLKIAQKESAPEKAKDEESSENCPKLIQQASFSNRETSSDEIPNLPDSQSSLEQDAVDSCLESISEDTATIASKENCEDCVSLPPPKEEETEPIVEAVAESNGKNPIDESISLLQLKLNRLMELKESLSKSINAEKTEIQALKSQIKPKNASTMPALNDSNLSNLNKIMDLLYKENEILQIKKITLVRQIMEQKEICIDLRAKFELLST